MTCCVGARWRQSKGMTADGGGGGYEGEAYLEDALELGLASARVESHVLDASTAFATQHGTSRTKSSRTMLGASFSLWAEVPGFDAMAVRPRRYRGTNKGRAATRASVDATVRPGEETAQTKMRWMLKKSLRRKLSDATSCRERRRGGSDLASPLQQGARADLWHVGKEGSTPFRRATCFNVATRRPRPGPARTRDATLARR